MTDHARFPGAVAAAWSSGFPTVAPSGGVFLRGPEWGIWNGALAVATLREGALRVFRLDRAGRVVGIDLPGELNGTFGRLRTPMMGPDGALYLTTANGTNDRIIRVRPTGPPFGALDRAAGRDGTVVVSGWAIDPNRRGAINVHLTVDGRFVRGVRADRSRPDVGAAHPGFGDHHGFATTLAVSPGSHRVCAWGINVGGGHNRLLGCRRT